MKLSFAILIMTVLLGIMWVNVDGGSRSLLAFIILSIFGRTMIVIRKNNYQKIVEIMNKIPVFFLITLIVFCNILEFLFYDEILYIHL